MLFLFLTLHETIKSKSPVAFAMWLSPNDNLEICFFDVAKINIIYLATKNMDDNFAKRLKFYLIVVTC